MDMLQGGMSWDEIVELAHELEKAGVSIISTHFTWHESAVPNHRHDGSPRSIHQRDGAAEKSMVNVPVITSNRINMPDVAEAVLERGDADLVSMARPMLADSQFMKKAAEGREDEINTCIACNQACLDHTFGGNQEVSCLVNPRACHETQLEYKPTAMPRSALPLSAQARRVSPTLQLPRNADTKSTCSSSPPKSAVSSIWRKEFRAKRSFTKRFGTSNGSSK
jgi:2,4-dienoyl-CoA reductase (NADPH2)